MRHLSTLLALFILKTVQATDPYPKNPSVDVIHYDFTLEVNDSTDRISGEAYIRIAFKKSITDFELDLTSRTADGKGMSIIDLRSEGRDLRFSHQNNRIRISFAKPVSSNDTLTFIIRYAGIPRDGLIIGKNKFGDRGFFGDNWPDRGHEWLPCVDHPSDKATVDFIIVAPEKYQVVGSGRLKEISNMGNRRKLTHWEETVPVAVKVMTVGIARFAMEVSGVVDQIPSSTWVYPQNRLEGFHDFTEAVKVFEYFHRSVGPYPYEKLAHVQSKTRWGGLENASNIFYTESSVNGKADHIGLIAHETAHQWFGNSVTENDWHHVWLSEGFASYFGSLYIENAYGVDAFREEMRSDRNQVIEYFKKNPHPVVDTTITDIGKVLNTNTYQKASWVLHMLRQQLGDETFWKGIREYYSRYKNKNTLTYDFRKVMEGVSGQDLGSFFRQWIYKSGHPQILATWTYDAKTKMVNLSVQQLRGTFQFPLEIGIRTPSGTEARSVSIDSPRGTFSFPSPVKPLGIELDPSIRLLYEGSITAK